MAVNDSNLIIAYPRPSKSTQHVQKIWVESDARPPIVLVLGDRDSGASLCANILSCLGIELGAARDFMPAEPASWHCPELAGIHDRLFAALRRAHGDSHDEGALLPGWWDEPSVAAIRAEIVAFLDTRARMGRFGFTEPRTIQLLPLWLDVTRELGLAPKLVFCLRRPPRPVRAADDPGLARYRWASSIMDFLVYSFGLDVCVIEYEKWLGTPSANVRRLTDFLNISWPCSAEELESIVAGLVSREPYDDETSELANPLLRSLYDLARQRDRDPATRQQAGGFALQLSDLRLLLTPLLRAAVSPPDERGQDSAGNNLRRALETHDRVVEERETVARDFDTLIGEYQRLAGEKAAIAAERDRFRADGESLRHERDGWIAAHGEAITERDVMARNYENLLAARAVVADSADPPSYVGPHLPAPMPLRMTASAENVAVPVPRWRAVGAVRRVLASLYLRPRSAGARTATAQPTAESPSEGAARHPPQFEKRVLLTTGRRGTDAHHDGSREAEFLSVLRDPAALRAAALVADEIATYQAYRRTADYTAAYARPVPLVSVCIATLDEADLLIDRALKSALTQSYRNLHVVVVGDCCTDETARRIAALGDSRVEFVNLPERGPYPPDESERLLAAGCHAVSHALSLAAGDFVTHLSAYDEMLPHRIEALVGAALATQADFLWHPLWQLNGDGTWKRSVSADAPPCAGAIFHHRFFTRYTWDCLAYRAGESSYANWLRKVAMLRPRAKYIDDPLVYWRADCGRGDAPVMPAERFAN